MPTAGWTRVRGLVDRISSVTGLWFGRRRSLTRRPRPAARRWREVVRGRLVVGGVVVVIWALGIEARLFYLQVLNHDELTARAEGQQSRSIDAHPKRGEILDRNGRMLAYSVDGDAIYAVPSEIEDPVGTANRLCEALDCSDATRQTLEGRLKKTSRAFEWVQRQVAPDGAQDRVHRGGAWDSTADNVRSADRRHASPDFRLPNYGAIVGGVRPARVITK